MTAAPSAVEPSPDPFHLTARVAHGGMATIYAATRGGEPVAVKLLHPHLAEDAHVRGMFLHEARLASRVRHENVVRVLGHGEHPVHGAYILMELLEGGDLAGLLKAAARTSARVPTPIVVRIVLDLCRGLDAAHELTGDDGAPLRLVHRDVSPHNLLVCTDGLARLTDFGIAKSDERYTMTRPGQLKGKLAYMAPEQLAHEDGLDRRIDVFAAGIVLWEALVGRRLFKGEDELSVINKVLLEKVPPPSVHDPALAPLDAVVLKALARERDERFPTARAFADALEDAARAIGGPASRAAVGALVRELLSDELRDRAARLERASLTPSGIREGAAREVTLSTPATRPRWTWALGVAVLLAGAAALGALGAWLARAPDPPPAAAGAAATVPAPPSPPAPLAAAPPPPEPPRAPALERAEPPQETLPSSNRRRPRRAPPAPAATAPAPPPAPAPAAPPPPRAAGTPSDDLYPNPFRD